MTDIQNLQLSEELGASPDVRLEMSNKGGWLPIETAPTDGTAVDIFCVHKIFSESKRFADMRWMKIGKYSGWYEAEAEGRPLTQHWSTTHWMPTPIPPND